jgi:hypothetical protein
MIAEDFARRDRSRQGRGQDAGPPAQGSGLYSPSRDDAARRATT